MLVVNYFRFLFWYEVSHYHHLRSNANLSKNADYLDDPERFKKYGKKVLYHSRRFWEIQQKLDQIKEEICNKYPDLRD